MPRPYAGYRSEFGIHETRKCLQSEKQESRRPEVTDPFLSSCFPDSKERARIVWTGTGAVRPQIAQIHTDFLASESAEWAWVI